MVKCTCTESSNTKKIWTFLDSIRENIGRSRGTNKGRSLAEFIRCGITFIINRPMADGRTCSNQPMEFDVMAAMCAGNRGIGFDGGLPWPKLR